MSEKKEKSKLSLSAKADKFDVPLSTLKKVYKRGVAAWNSGHRPGTTPQQWGHARVNSFLRKGKTYHTADKDLREEAMIKGTNCKNCIWWKKDSEQKVDKSELNENGGLKAPNEAYVKMSKHVDMVTLPGKAAVDVKAFCDHDDIKDFVTERMCCAYWDGEGVKREFKGEADVLSEEQLNELDIQTYNKYIEATYSQTPAAQARKLGGPKHAQRTLGRLRARKLKQKQIDKPENQAKLAQIRAEHEALHNPNKDPSGRGYGEGRYMGDHVEHDPDINKLFEDQMNEGVRQLFSLDPQKKQSFAQTAVETGLGTLPVIGQALALRDIERARRAGDKKEMALAAASMLPVGRLANVAGKARKIFVPASKEAQDALKAMEKAGKSREEIWAGTKTTPGGSAFRHPQTGEIRQEISDDLIALQRKQAATRNLPGKPVQVQTHTGKAKDVVKHDELFKKFPELGEYKTDVEVYKSADPKKSISVSGVMGKFDPSKKEVLARGGSEKSALGTFVHEIQHAVQRKSGGAGGTNPA